MRDLDLRLSHVRKSYDRPVLMDINLHVTNDTYVTILGSSGSGKSTLLNILGLVESHDSGEYRFNGTLIHTGVDYPKLRLHDIGFIFQNYNLIPTLSCKENILLPCMYKRSCERRNFDRLVSLLKIDHLLSQRVVTLSGGEKQRVAVARALILDPCLILADEPTGNLDPANREIIISLLRHEHQQGRGIILITHDDQTAKAADTVLRLEGGFLHES